LKTPLQLLGHRHTALALPEGLLVVWPGRLSM
jgi:hypothetical protein